jgi:hypothetical protein
MVKDRLWRILRIAGALFVDVSKHLRSGPNEAPYRDRIVLAEVKLDRGDQLAFRAFKLRYSYCLIVFFHFPAIEG